MGKIRIISREGKQFRDREEAGKLLASALATLRGQNTVVLGIPRGGVIVARELARALLADLDVVIARKLRTPGQEELAMGSVAENGALFLNRSVIEQLNISADYVERERALQMAEIARRSQLIRRSRPKVPLEGRKVVVTDDGVATGATLEACLSAVRAEHPSLLVCALPVGPENVVVRLAKDVDEIVCLRAPPLFAAVGQFYRHFYQVEDEEMVNILEEESRRGARA